MAREIAEIPAAVARLASSEARACSRSVAADLRARAPKALITVARGSSDHAATYLSYAVQSVLRIPVASIGPSISSVYQTSLRMEGLAALAISQSGASRDLVTLCDSFAANGGHVVTLTNTPDSPLAKASAQVLNVAAGPERAVAATKSFVNSVVAGLWLIADWADDLVLADALERLPDAIECAKTSSATDALEPVLTTAPHAVVIARGAGLGLAHEIALKLIETCAIHASSYSAAEVLHGPRALLTDGYPVIALKRGAGQGLDQALEQLPAQGAHLLLFPEDAIIGHPLVDPLLDILPFYELAERASRARGLDPDNPSHLLKETKTL